LSQSSKVKTTAKGYHKYQGSIGCSAAFAVEAPAAAAAGMITDTRDRTRKKKGSIIEY
jgi:hypothetical protein